QLPTEMRVFVTETSTRTRKSTMSVDTARLVRLVLVGDRGMLTQPQIAMLKTAPGLGWITALTSVAIRKLVTQGALQLSLFDHQHLAEISSPDFPGERLMACYNPVLAQERSRKRQALLEATEQGMTKLERDVARRTKKPLAASAIGLKAGKILERHKVGKHYQLTIGEGRFQWIRRDEAIAAEATLDGIYVIRTSEPAARFSAADTVRTYKSLSQVERAFRCLKGIDVLVRPIRHRTEARVPAHIFLCVLAYHVEWHMRRAFAPMLFEDEELPAARSRRDPVLPTQPTASAKAKKATHTTPDGLPVHSFESLIAALVGRARTINRLQSDAWKPTFI